MSRHDPNSRPLCGAATRAGGVCRAPAMPNGKCRVHGGASLAGPAHPSWVHGRRSRYAHRLAAHQQSDFEDALNAPDPLSLADEIALVRVFMMQELRGQLDAGALRRELIAARCALAAEDSETAGNRVEDAIALLDGSREVDHEALTRQMGTLKGLVDTSARVMDIRANSFTRIQSMALIARVVELIAGNVRDPQDRKRLLTALSQMSVEVAPALLTTSRNQLE